MSEAETAPPRVEFDPTHPNWTWSLCRGIARMIVTLAFDLKVYNRHFIPNDGGVLVVSNHQSYLDPILIGAHLRRPMSYLAKSELFTNRYFGGLIRRLRAFPVKQGSGDVGAVKETIRRLREGHMLTIFPEGARSEDGEIGPILSGAALVVKRAGVPVIPCVVDGSFVAWPRSQKLPRRHPVSVLFGPAMKLDHLDGRQITELIDRTLRQMFAELRQKEAEAK